MDPQYQYQAPAPQPDFNFILNPNQPSKKNFSPTSKKQKIIVVVGGFLLLAIIFTIAFSLLANSGKESSTVLLDLAAEQQEVVRVAGLGSKATDQDLKDFAITTEVSVASDQQSLKAYLKKNVKTYKEANLTAKKNKKTDAALDEALASGQFDTTFKSILTTLLLQYGKDIQTAAKKSTKVKTILSSSYGTLAVLLKNTTTP